MPHGKTTKYLRRRERDMHKKSDRCCRRNLAGRAQEGQEEHEVVVVHPDDVAVLVCSSYDDYKGWRSEDTARGPGGRTRRRRGGTLHQGNSLDSLAGNQSASEGLQKQEGRRKSVPGGCLVNRVSRSDGPVF